jgi:hypothetical protein
MDISTLGKEGKYQGGFQLWSWEENNCIYFIEPLGIKSKCAFLYLKMALDHNEIFSIKTKIKLYRGGGEGAPPLPPARPCILTWILSSSVDSLTIKPKVWNNFLDVSLFLHDVISYFQNLRNGRP